MLKENCSCGGKVKSAHYKYKGLKDALPRSAGRVKKVF